MAEQRVSRSAFFSGPNSQLPPNTLVVLTFDESDFEDTAYEGPNRIYTVLLGDGIEPGTSQSEPGNHYTLLRTIEENFSLGNLGKNDAGANYFRFLWGENFQWAAPAGIPVAGSGGLAAAAWGASLVLVTLNAGDLVWQSYDGAASGLLLVYQAATGLESAARQHLHGGGGEPERHRRFAAAEQSDLHRRGRRDRHGRAGRLHPADRAVAPIRRLAGGDLFAEPGSSGLQMAIGSYVGGD